MSEPFKLNPLPVYDEHYAATQQDWSDFEQTATKCDDYQQCSPDAKYDDLARGLTSVTLKCRLCGGVRRIDWD